MADRIVVLKAVTLGGDRLPARWEVPLEVWMRLPVRERNRLLNLGKVERE